MIAFSAVANIGVSTFLYRRARALDSPALEGDAAHLRTDALTSLGVLVGLVLVEITGEPAFDAIAALLRRRGDRRRRASDPHPLGPGAGRRGAAGGRARPDRGARSPPSASAAPEIAGYHKLRARRAGARRYIDLHLQFRSGTTLEHAHAIAHAVRGAIEAEIPQLRGPDPQRARGVPSSARAGGAGALPRRVSERYRAGQSRFTAAAKPTAATTIE